MVPDEEEQMPDTLPVHVPFHVPAPVPEHLLYNDDIDDEQWRDEEFRPVEWVV
jgi:hypothetical protein